MGFWESFKASQQAYYEFISSMRERRSTFKEIDQSIYQLDRWKNEFQSLQSAASAERNSTAALGRIADVLSKINNKTNQLLELRQRLNDTLKNTRERIQRLREGIPRIQDSLKYDYEKFHRMREGSARRDHQLKIREKEKRLDEMRSTLLNLELKEKDIERD